jgi:hypothetical protein
MVHWQFGSPEWVTAFATIVIAVFTIVLGLFTVSLAKSTRKAANAAEKALVELERPWLFVEGATITRREIPGQALIPNNWSVSFTCRNVGRSPAIVQECIIKIEQKDKMP